MIQQLIAGILRHVLTVLGGSLVTQGYLDGEQLTSAIGAILTLVGIGWSIWQKYKARPKPADAVEVRRAIPVEPEAKYKLSPAAKKALNPNEKGFIELGVLLRLLLIVSVVTLFFLLGKLAVAETPSVVHSTSEIEGGPVRRSLGGGGISFGLVEDQRPFLVRLLSSARLWTEAGNDTRWRVDEYGLRAKGQDAQGQLGVDLADVAVGVKFGTDF